MGGPLVFGFFALEATFLPPEWWRALDADGGWRRDVDEPADLEREL